MLSRIAYLNSWFQSINKLAELTNRKKMSSHLSFLFKVHDFCLQFYIMSKAFGLPLDFYSIFIIVGVMFGVVTLIPSLIPGNLGTKEAF